MKSSLKTKEHKNKQVFSRHIGDGYSYSSHKGSNIALREKEVAPDYLPEREAAYEELLNKYGIISNPGMDIYIPGTQLCINSNLLPAGSYKNTDFIMLIRSTEDSAANKIGLDKSSFRFSPIKLTKEQCRRIKQAHPDDKDIAMAIKLYESGKANDKTTACSILRKSVIKSSVEYADVKDILYKASMARDFELCGKVFTTGSSTLPELHTFLDNAPNLINKYDISQDGKTSVQSICSDLSKGIDKLADPLTKMVFDTDWEKYITDYSLAEKSLLNVNILKLIFSLSRESIEWKKGIPAIYLIEKAKLSEHFDNLNKTTPAPFIFMNKMAEKEINEWIKTDNSELNYNGKKFEKKTEPEESLHKVITSYSDYDDVHSSVSIYHGVMLKYIDLLYAEDKENVHVTENTFSLNTGQKLVETWDTFKDIAENNKNTQKENAKIQSDTVQEKSESTVSDMSVEFEDYPSEMELG